MSWKIGVPSIKLNNAGKRTAHTGDFGAVAREALGERIGKDADIDRSRSHENVYVGFRTAAELIEYSRKHIEEMKVAGARIRSDAVVMCATVFKPPASYMHTLSPFSQRRILEDCLTFLQGIVGLNNVKAGAFHRDEQGMHLHVLWEPMTPDGRLCAKEMHNIEFFKTINEKLPAFLRERGWDIEDADCYDRSQREAEDLKKETAGRSSAQYKLDAERERQEALKQIDSLKAKEAELTKRIDDLNKLITALLEGFRIQTIDQLMEAHERIAYLEKTLEKTIDRQNTIIEELRDVASSPIRSTELPSVVQSVLFLWRKVECLIREIFRRLRGLILNVFAYQMDVDASDLLTLEERLERANARAGMRKGVNNNGEQEELYEF